MIICFARYPIHIHVPKGLRVLLSHRFPVLFCTCTLLFSCNREQEPASPLSPQEAMDSFVLADPELEMQLVAAEPLVQDPVAISFDEGGRLWVVEMLGFMTDIDGTGEGDPTGRVSVLFDDDKDGRMDRSIVFLDSLVLPRAIAIVKGGALVAENIPLWFAADTDGDFKADTKELIDSAYGGQGMPEHSANGLWRGMDNWLYNAKSKYRYRQVEGKWVRDETEFRGQWGISHDNSGRLFYNYNWSQLHADLVPPNVLQRNVHHTPTSGTDHGLTPERAIYPIRSNTAVNRGYVPGTLDGEGKLLEFASACGPLIYRGNALPGSYSGDAFVCEPTANLIKQDNILEDGFMLRAEGVYNDREFLASTDERFRPVSLASGPDGGLYIVDMYKGIIQDGPYMTPYLREVTLERKLDKPIHMGRIWRITSGNKAANKGPDLENAGERTLVGYLGDPNGWTRDMAQRLLVEKEDLSIVGDLEQLILNGEPLARLHALWTLEGLGYAGPDIYYKALRSEDVRVASAALRRLMQLIPGIPGVKKHLEAFISSAYDGAAPALKLQMVLSGNELEAGIALHTDEQFLRDFGTLPVARDAVLSTLQDRESLMLASLLNDPEWTMHTQSAEILFEMLATAIANKGDEKEINTIFRILDQPLETKQHWVKTALVNGMMSAREPVDGQGIRLTSAPAFFKIGNSLGEEDQGLVAALKNRFTWPGKPIIAVKEADAVPDIDRAVYAGGRRHFLNLCASCHGTQGEGMRRFAPPLRQSHWVNGKDYRLAMILLHGMEGPVSVNGQEYGIPDILPEMPSFSTLQNEDIAAIATYIRNSWGNSAGGISPGLVGSVRFRTQGKITPWQAEALDTVQFDKNQ